MKKGELDQIVLSLVSKVSSNMGCHDELPSLSNITTQKQCSSWHDNVQCLRYNENIIQSQANCFLSNLYLLQVKIKFRLKFLIKVDFQFPFSASTNYSWFRARKQWKLRINLGYKISISISKFQFWPVTYRLLIFSATINFLDNSGIESKWLVL